MQTAGNCVRNNDCNQVTCFGDGSEDTTPNITVTFPATPTSACSIRMQVTVLPIVDETVTENRDIPVPAAGLTINLMVNFSPAGNVNTVRYGVS